MIDTDKYENITPERWAVDEEDPCRVIDVQECTIARTDFVNIEEEREWQLANAQLIADAPLLLAEVKRLYEEPRVTINEWDYKPDGNADAEPLPCVSVYHGGCEYVGRLRLYKNEDGKVIE